MHAEILLVHFLFWDVLEVASVPRFMLCTYVIPAFANIFATGTMKFSQAGLSTIFAISLPALALSSQASSVRAITESKYSTAHSLGDGYIFDLRDGWQRVNVTNLQYKYRRQSELDFDDSQADDYSGIESRSKKPQNAPKKAERKPGLGSAITGVVNGILKGLKGIGKPEPVTITW